MTSENPNDVETRREWLLEFLKRFWKVSIENSQGKKTKVILLPLKPTGFIDPSKLPFIEVEVGPQVTANLSAWQETSKRLLVTPSPDIDKIGLSFYEEALGGVHKINMPLDREGKKHLLLKYSNIKGVADLETDSRKARIFPPEPTQGRPNVNFRVIEMFTDTRKALLKPFKKLSPTQQKIADSDLLDYLKQTEMAQAPAVKG